MDDTGCLTMSAKELNRLEILGRVLERRLTQTQAAQQLGLSVRQVERLCRKLRVEGPRGLVSQKRGRVSNRTPSPLNAAVVPLEFSTADRDAPFRDIAAYPVDPSYADRRE